MENIIIARVTHHQMKQDRDEPVRSFVARLKGQAGTCNYTMKHTCSCKKESDINYSEEMVRNILASGLADNDIQRDLFGDANQEMPLEQMINFIEAKEGGKRSASQVTSTVRTFAVRSTYKRDVNRAVKTHNQSTRSENSNIRYRSGFCGWCGKKGHEKYDLETRRRLCPAFDHSCKKCGRHGHYDSLCRGKSMAKFPNTSTIYTGSDPYSSDSEILIDATHHQASKHED